MSLAEQGFEVDGDRELVETGEGSVWLVNKRDQLIVQVDPARNAVARTIAFDSSFVEHFAVGGGSIWLPDQRYDIDTRTWSEVPGQVAVGTGAQGSPGGGSAV